MLYTKCIPLADYCIPCSDRRFPRGGMLWNDVFLLACSCYPVSEIINEQFIVYSSEFIALGGGGSCPTRVRDRISAQLWQCGDFIQLLSYFTKCG